MKSDDASGILVAIEGVTGAGKTYLADKLEEELRITHPKLRVERYGGFRERPGLERPSLTKFLHQLMLYYRFIGLPWLCETTLLLSEQAYNLEKYVMPAYSAGAVILYENYNDALMAYQLVRAAEQSISIEEARAFLDSLIKVQYSLCRYPKESILVYLESPLEVICQRLKAREHNTVTKRDRQTIVQVKQQYEMLYAKRKHYQIDNDGTSDLGGAVKSLAQQITRARR